MALQELSPLPAVTGYSGLGNVIAGAGADYLNRSRQLQDTAAAREFATAEAERGRAFQSSEAEKANARSLTNAQTLDTQRNYEAGLNVLIAEGYLDGALRADRAAVADAFRRAQADGVTKLYAELLQTPDENGRPLLTVESAIDHQAVQAAKAKLGEIKARQIQFQQGQQGNAQATVNEMSQQLAQIRAQKEAITARANAPTPQVSAGDPQVLALAAQMAEQTKPGSGRNREAVAAQVPLALKEINDRAFLAWSQATQSAKTELESLRRSEAELTSVLERAMSTFKIAPSVRGTPAALQTPAVPAPAARVASAEDIANAMRAAVGGAPAGTPAALAPIDNPMSDPTIAAGNEAIQRQQAAVLQSHVNELEAKSRNLEAALTDADRRSTRSAAFSPSMFPGASMTSALNTNPDPIGAAKTKSDLLKAKAANDAELAAARAQLMGPVPAGSTAPATNTPAASTPSIGAAQPAPAWWKTAVPPPSGM